MKTIVSVFAVGLVINAFGEGATANTNGSQAKINDFARFGDYCRSLSTNELAKLRVAYPFFDGMPPDIPEDDIRRTDDWEGEVYKIMKRNENGEWLPLSKAEITRNRLNAGPYLYNLPSFTSLGQLTKQCDGVFIGEVVKVKFASPVEEAEVAETAARGGLIHQVTLTFRVITNLFGHISGDRVTIPIMWQEKFFPVAGMKMLLFYAKGYTIDIWDREPSNFDWEKPAAVVGAPPAVMTDKGSYVRLLDTPERERAYTEAANGYLRLLRREKRDPYKYYEFLRSLIKSPVWRIRRDARKDLLKLVAYRRPDNFDVKPLLDDPELMDFFKDVIRYIAIPAQEQRKAEAQKE